MKQRYSSLDVKAASIELSSLAGLRVTNIYDLSSRIFLFKVAKPGVRKQLVVDAGFRCHLTEYSRTTAPEPSHFVRRLRTFLKTRRITKVSQVGTDRILHFEFSDGYFHLLLEFFAAGNIILTDNEYKIIALQRNVAAGADQEEVSVGLTYTLDNKQNYHGIPPLSVERLRETLEKAKAKEPTQADTSTNKREKKKQAQALRRALSHGFPEFPPLLLEHALQSVGFDTTLRPEEVVTDDGLLERLVQALRVAEEVRIQIESSDKIKTYIIARQNQKAQETPADSTSQAPKPVYEDFHPFEPKQFMGAPDFTILPFEDFNKAVDEFFSSVEAQKLESRLTEREEIAHRKLESARKDQEKRVGALRQVQEMHVRKAQAIEANMARVEEAMNAVNGLVAQGMDWTEIARLIEMEQGKKNPVAKTIKLPLKLYENTITLQLAEATSDDEEEEEEEPEEEDSESSDDEEKAPPQKAPAKSVLNIDIDLGQTPWANATQYYEEKKTVAVKQEKTVQASAKALKSAEKKITGDLKQGLKQEKPVLRPARTPFWFEKFLFFVSSEGYLVIGGRDAGQTDMIYRRHLKRGDVYVHSDAKGAVPMVVKNRVGTPNAPIPPGTLSQAGTFSVTTSAAWDSKALLGSWWVEAEQVSKIGITGEYVTTGDMVIRGEKNHLAPGQLILGFAVLFYISPESVQNHTKHRLEKDDIPAENDEEQPEAEPTPNDSPSGGDGASSPVRSGEQAGGSKEFFDDNEGEDIPGDKTVPEAEEDAGEERVSETDSREAGTAEKKEGEGSDSPVKEAEAKRQDLAEGEAEGEVERGAEEEAEGGAEQDEDDDEDGGGEEEEAESRSSAPLSSHTQSTTPTSQPTNAQKPRQGMRGKRGKSKKMAQKYKHQDDEDRELALRLLGAAPKQDIASKPATATSSAPTANKGKTKAERDAELEVQKQRRRAQHERAAQAEHRRQEAIQRGEEIAEEGKDIDETADLRLLPSLVGNPLPADEILAGIPVCGPWSALGSYKYRLKMQPGPMKKGKAVREMTGRWIAEGTAREKEKAKGKGKKPAGEEQATEDAPKDTEAQESALESTELELIKGWRDVEVVNVMPVSGVRIVAGASAASKGKGDTKGKGGKSESGGGKGGGGGGGKGAKGGKGSKGGKKK